MRKIIDLTGQRFGKLIPIKQNGRSKDKYVIWLCKCDCGLEINVNSKSLISGNTKSCGCWNFEFALTHGYARTPTYGVWVDMKQRCLNPNNKNYKNYGKRGITICDRWLNKEKGFENFLKDMGEKPKGLTLDRIDNNILINSYSQVNCKWASYKKQGRNKRNNRLETYNGKTQCRTEWEEEYNLPSGTLIRRIDYYGWSLEKALLTPVRVLNRK